MVDPNGDDGIVHHYAADSFTRIIFTAIAGVLAAGVVGIWSMAIHMATLEERMAQWTISMASQITVITAKELSMQDQITAINSRQRDNESHIFRNDARIDALERERK